MNISTEYHSHRWTPGGKAYQLKQISTSGSAFSMPHTYYEVWDQHGQSKLIDKWFRSVGAAVTKANTLNMEGK